MNKVKEEKDKNMNNKTSLKKFRKSEKGITLIVLVITIIVLLIIAGVSIAMLTGQNGILSRANEAAEETKRKTAEEKVAVEVLGSYGEDGNIDISRLNENLKNVEGLTSGLPIDKLSATVVVDGYDITINESGSATAGDTNNTPETGGTDENNYLTEAETKELIKEVKLEMYPVGSIYITTNEQNPGEYLGGKWESYGEGRTIVGAGTGTDSNNVQKVFEINETGGEYEHTLTVNEMPNHYHQYYRQYVGSGYTDYNNRTLASNGQVSGGNPPAANTNAVGGNQAHNNIQPYIVTYIWKRIS